MKAPTQIWYYFLADSQNRTCSWIDGTVVKNNIPTPLPQNPSGWKDVEIKFGTNSKYFSMNRNFSAPLKFINDGANIIRWFAYKGKGFEEDLYVLIFKWDRTSGKHILEYNGRIDISKMIDDPYTGVTVNTLEGGALRYLNANEGITYNIPCDARNNKAIKTLFDGVNLNVTYNWTAPKIAYGPHTSIIGLTFTNSQGDSSGVIRGDQNFQNIANENFDLQTILNALAASSNYLLEYTHPTQVRIFGTWAMAPGSVDANGNVIYGGTLNDTIIIALATPSGVRVLNTQTLRNQTGEIRVNIDDTFTYNVNDKVSFIMDKIEPGGVQPNLIPTDNFKISATMQTKQVPSTAYSLRPLDLGQAIVAKMSNGECSLVSNFLTINNKRVITCGDALRNIDPVNAGIDGYNIKTSFSDWFLSFNIYNLGIKIIGNVIHVEPKADLFNDSSKIFDLGEGSEFTIEAATDYIFNSVKVGFPDQNYQGVTQNDGKLEFNSQQEWIMPVTVVNKTYDIMSKYRGDSFGIEFIRQSLPSNGATYNDADNAVFMIDITDQTEQLETPVSTGISITVNHAPTVPITVTPSNQETVHHNKPLVSGYATPTTLVGILVDGIQDGHTTSDTNGFWQYQIVGAMSSLAIDSNGTVIATGKHTISSAYTDGAGVVSGSATLSTVNVIIDTTVQSVFVIETPGNNDSLYNNKPLIKGLGPNGTSVDIYIDGVFASTVTVDNSCRWEYQVVFPLTDRAHSINAVNGANSVIININVAATSIQYPLITNPTTGFIYTSQPVIEGVAKPGANVTLYLDYTYLNSYGSPTNLATAVADYFGNWSVTVPTPISDGDHIISTTQDIEYVNVAVSGYKLDRPAFSSVIGVTDNTVFNTKMRPRQTLLNHGNMVNLVLFQQPTAMVSMSDAKKNKTFTTVLNGIIFRESDPIMAASFGAPIALPWKFKVKTKVPYTFSQIMQLLQTGYIQVSVKGRPVYGLPIGDMTSKPASEEAQTWTLLAAPNNSLETFLHLSDSPILIISYNNNMISISNLNPLHFVKYNFVQDPKYHDLDINDDWLINRHPSYISRPNYFQKWQKTDTISLQFMTAGIGALRVQMTDAFKNITGNFDCTILSNPLVQPPYYLQQVNIPLAAIAEGSYVFTLFADGVPKAISEWIDLRVDHPGTYLSQYTSSFDKLNGYFDSWSPMIRFEGLFTPWKPDSDFTDYEDEQKDIELLHAVPSAVRTLIMGKPFGIPDWMSLKLNEILLLNRCLIDGVRYTRTSDSKMEESATQGHTMSWYKTTVRKAINDSSLTITDSTDIPAPIGGMILTLDGEAFGKANQVIQVTVNKE